MKCSNHLCQSEGISQCSKCKQVYYCSRQGQQISWKKHKHECCEKVDKVEENDDNHNKEKDDDDDNNDGNDEDEKVEKDNNNDETLSKSRYCLNCLKQLEHSNKNTCSRCRTATYCNQICQTEHWKVHKRTCQDSNYDHGFQKLYAKAVNYKDQGNFKKAYKAYKKINDFLCEASVYPCPGKYADAERLLVDCLRRQKIQSGGDVADLKIATILASLSDIYKNQGRYFEAVAQHSQSLEILKSLKGENSIDCITSLGNLGGIYYSQGRSQEALEILEAVLKKKLLLQGDSHISTLNTMSFLGSVYTNLGRLDDAEEMHRKCLEKRKEAYGPNHNDVIESMHNLAGTISDKGDLSAAEALYLECLEKQKIVLGENYPFYLVTMNTLGLTYDRQGKYALS